MKPGNNVLNASSTVKDALARIDEAGTSLSTLFVVDNNNVLLGTLTDGDIRRGLLRGASLSDNVVAIMQVNFRKVSVQQLKNYSAELENMKSLAIRFVPVTDDDGKLVEILDLDVTRDIIPVAAFLLAGGKGERLLPVTRDIPKPLIKVGDKPIIAYNVLRLVKYGITDIYISINYLGQLIEDYFGDGNNFNASVKYVREKSPLGTLGSLTLIEDTLPDDVLVMNSDLLTNIDLSDFYSSYKASGADMAVVVKPFYQDFPYAVINTDEKNMVTSLKEKPRFTYYTNAGIYIISKKLISTMKKGERLDASDFMESVIKSGSKVYSYPIVSYWLDIGKPEDLRKAQEDIKHLHI